MPDRSSPYLTVTEDAELEVYIERRNTTTRKLEPATGLTGVKVLIAATKGGSAIGTLDIDLAERSSTQSPGYYFAIVDAATLVSQLPAGTYPDGSDVWLGYYKPGDFDKRWVRKTVRRNAEGDG